MNKYSPSTGGIYPVSILQDYEKAGTLPDDLIEISDEERNGILEGKKLTISEGGERIWAFPPKSLADIQKAKIAELEAAYSAAMQESVEFTTAAGVTATFQADTVSQDLLLKAATGFGIYGETYPGFYWVAEDNSKVPFTLADLKGLYLVMLMQGGAVFQRLQDRKDAARAAQTVEEVQSIEW